MIIKLTADLEVKTELPYKKVLAFGYSWTTDCHAALHVRGYLDKNASWDDFLQDASPIKIWMGEGEERKIIFAGIIAGLEIEDEGNLELAAVYAASASILLDCEKSSRSFQNTEKTYGEVAREAAGICGGSVIRNREQDKKIEEPVIQYEETAWQLAAGLAARVGTCIIPDIATGRPNFWFGMRKGNEISPFSEEEYTMDLFPSGKSSPVHYEAEGRNHACIGDTLVYLNRKLVITEVEGRYENGEATFRYVMREAGEARKDIPVCHTAAGLGLWGTVMEVKGESLRLALDIDGGRETGNYFYPWQPDTGNALYAMPEAGARALLYFYHADKTDGAVIHCINKKDAEKDYKKRALDTEAGNGLHLWDEEAGVYRGDKHKMELGNSTIAAKTQKELEVTAGGSVFLRGRRIMIKTPGEFNISQA